MAVSEDGISVHRRRSPSKRDRLAYVIKVTSLVLVGLGVPRYSSEFSNRLYDVHIKIGVLIMRQYLDASFREICSMLSSMKVWKGKVPDHSTFVKFSKRIDAGLLDRTLWAMAHMLCGNDMVIAVDSTGFSCSNASRHFVKRLKETGSKIGYTNDAKKGFSKASLAVDTSTKMILACDCIDSNNADVKRMTFLIDDLADGGFSVAFVVADKGYDAEYVHVEIKERMNATAFIPLRNMSKPAKLGRRETRTSGFNRGRMKFFFDKEKYNMRSIVETVNSMVKRKMSDTVYGRTEHTRHKEVLLRCIAHNARRLMDAGHLI